ncbi:MAG: hypothetical protein U1A28_05395, partial [Patescibacteria group bacterium]|nr:hypothetical protein [Patescibacteria group bacterium]
MAAPFITLLITGSVTVALVALFRYERVRGIRYARTIRTAFDNALEDMQSRLTQKYRQATGQAVRQSVHYVFHRALSG